MSWQTVGSFRNDPKSVKGKKLDKLHKQLEVYGLDD